MELSARCAALGQGRAATRGRVGGQQDAPAQRYIVLRKRCHREGAQVALNVLAAVGRGDSLQVNIRLRSPATARLEGGIVQSGGDATH